MGNQTPTTRSFGEVERKGRTHCSLWKDKSTPPSAADLMNASVLDKKLYWDRSQYKTKESYMTNLHKTSTVYVGNLTFSTRSSHLKALFSTLGPVNEIRLGLNRYTQSPCGFAFVEYVHRHNALDAVAYLSGTKLDGRVIRVELDAGFKPGREFGRGISGGQVSCSQRLFILFRLL